MEQTQHTQHQAQKSWYDRYYKLLLAIPILFFILCIGYLVFVYTQTGDIIYKDVSITGGTTITVFHKADIEEVKLALSEKFPDAEVRAISDIRTGEQQGFFVETRAEAEDVKKALEEYLGFPLTSENSSVEFTGSSLSSSFYNQLRIAIIIAFLLMGIVVFFIFRTPIPSLAVIFAAFADIIMTIAVIDFFHIELSTAGIVALLMLIGYSVDTDILLTMRVLKAREGKVNDRIKGAFKTGLTMTLTAIAAVTVSLIFIYTFSDILRQMFTILLIGLGFDIVNTWLTNASMLKWYTQARRLE